MFLLTTANSSLLFLFTPQHDPEQRSRTGAIAVTDDVTQALERDSTASESRPLSRHVAMEGKMGATGSKEHKDRVPKYKEKRQLNTVPPESHREK